MVVVCRRWHRRIVSSFYSCRRSSFCDDDYVLVIVERDLRSETRVAIPFPSRHSFSSQKRNFKLHQKEEEGMNSSVMEVDHVEVDKDSASEKPQIHNNDPLMLALVSALENCNPFKVDPVDSIKATTSEKRPKEVTINLEELENNIVAKINADTDTNALVCRILRLVLKHLTPSLAEIGVQLRIKDDRGEDAVEINADEEVFAILVASEILGCLRSSHPY